MELYDFILSEQNIYLAIYEARSYVFDSSLLSAEDKTLLYAISDPFNEEQIKDIIKHVQHRLKQILDSDELFNVQVYFKPKGFDVNEKQVDYRPIHTAGLTEMISMVAMLHTLVYEIPDLETDAKLQMSNYSRLIPNNFYGNRVSKRPEELFEKWKEGYKKYTEQANDFFKIFHTTKEYRYELKLDIKQFFPSVNPAYVYQYLIERLPISFELEDQSLLNEVIYKLLICNVTNIKTKEAQSLYYGKDISLHHYTKGIAQGLPQSYFFGNICMIEISKIIQEQYKGKAVYYVDDSYVYTNEINSDKEFYQSIKALNNKISERLKVDNKKILADFCHIQEKYLDFYEGISATSQIQIHEAEKSYCFDISVAKIGEIYLRSLSREASELGSEINNAFSTEEDRSMLSKSKALLNAIDKELELLNSEGQNKALDSYKEKLIRYRKYFKYRTLKLKLKSEKIILDNEIIDILIGNSESKENPLDRLNEFLSQFKNVSDDKKNLYEFTELVSDRYKNDIWQVTVDMIINFSLLDRTILKDYIKLVIEVLYSKNLRENCYIFKYYESFLNDQNNTSSADIYFSLEKAVNKKMSRYIKLHEELVINEFKNSRFLELSKNLFDTFGICSNEWMRYIKIVDTNSDRLKRMLINAIYSSLFKVTVSDSPIINCYDKKGLTYGALRLLLYIRNTNVKITDFFEWNIDLQSFDNRQKIDFDLLEVLEVYNKYVCLPDRIDQLIQIHKYTCDVWKNGAKHLYFYTLHNQEHAIDLVKNIVKIVKTLSYFKVTAYDYYLLFISCYLHDISMVKTATPNDFLLDNSSDKIAYELIREWNNSKDILASKNAIIKTYYEIDNFFEKKIRTNHGRNSAEEIRERGDLSFLEEGVREFAAEISESHIWDVRDIYFVKGEAKNKLISLKFDKILLRLADLLDMSDHRVSKSILEHNADNITSESAFHWISHILTSGYELSTEYVIKPEKENDYLSPGSINENITLVVYVSLSQLSKSHTSNCKYMKINDDSITFDGFELVTINKKKKGIEELCRSNNCNFLCKWFNKKNQFLIQELQALNAYLERVPVEERFYNTSISIKVKVIHPTLLSDGHFEIIKNNI